MLLNLFIFLSAVFLLTFLLGRLIEKIRVPWIFAALLIGSGLAFYNPFKEITSSAEFRFLAELGMYFLLFIIGFEIDIKKLRRLSRFIFRSTFFIILFEALFGTLIVHYIFHYPWFVSSVVALSFATVGEAILVPILEEFNVVNTKLGHSIIGIGTFDDLIEILTLILAMILIGGKISTTNNFESNVLLILIGLLFLFGFAFLLTKFKKEARKFNFLRIESVFIFVLFILFLFLGVGKYANSEAIAALLAGIALKTFLPKKRLKTIESEIKTLCYGFFAPIFFLWVGIEMDMRYLIAYPFLILLVVAVSKGAKILASIVAGKKELGLKDSILLGIGLSVRFSTSIIIVKILFEKGVIGSDIYSVIVGSSIAFKFIVPVLFANLLARWHLKNFKKPRKSLIK